MKIPGIQRQIHEIQRFMASESQKYLKKSQYFKEKFCKYQILTSYLILFNERVCPGRQPLATW